MHRVLQFTYSAHPRDAATHTYYDEPLLDKENGQELDIGECVISTYYIVIWPLHI